MTNCKKNVRGASTIMKMSSFEIGKHWLHNDEKGFCIIILDVTNRLQATDYIIILKIGVCERKKHIRTSSNPEHKRQHAIASSIKLLAYVVFFHVLSTIMVAVWALTKD